MALEVEHPFVVADVPGLAHLEGGGATLARRIDRGIQMVQPWGAARRSDTRHGLWRRRALDVQAVERGQSDRAAAVAIGARGRSGIGKRKSTVTMCGREKAVSIHARRWAPRRSVPGAALCRPHCTDGT